MYLFYNVRDIQNSSSFSETLQNHSKMLKFRYALSATNVKKTLFLFFTKANLTKKQFKKVCSMFKRILGFNLMLE